MENYKKTLRNRMRMYGGSCFLASLTIWAVNWLTANARTPLDEHGSGFVHGLAAGATLVVIAMTVFQMVRIRLALTDDVMLRRLYIAETDERKRFIRQQVGGAGMQLSVALLMFAAVIACYFNIMVTYVLVGAALCVSMVMLGFKLYYRNKY